MASSVEFVEEIAAVVSTAISSVKTTELMAVCMPVCVCVYEYSSHIEAQWYKTMVSTQWQRQQRHYTYTHAQRERERESVGKFRDFSDKLPLSDAPW